MSSNFQPLIVILLLIVCVSYMMVEPSTSVNDDEIDTKTALLTQPAAPKKNMKFFLGILALLLVDVIWVASSEVTEYLFKDVKFDKPYMSTYVKTSMFSIYLIGFIFYGPWRRQCIRCAFDDYPGQYQLVGETDTEDTDDGDYTVQSSLGEPMYVPAKIPSASEVESDSERRTRSPVPRARVKFNNLMEVRHLEDCQESKIARMNYGAALRAKFRNKALQGFLTISQVLRISFIFATIFFLGNLSYQEALALNEVAVVNIISTTSGIFTLILAALFPSGPSDKFTLTKFVAVSMLFVGIVVVTLAADGTDPSKLFLSMTATTGALWALLGAFSYSLYLVFFKRSVGEQGQIDIPMFFGFVGLFCSVFLWPGMAALHYLHFETFQLPDRLPAIIMVANGFIGTVISELLWLWGCIATSSLVGTMSLGLNIPLSILMDIIFRKAQYTWLFYFGASLVVLSFVLVSFLTHRLPARDPIWSCLKRCFCCCCKRKLTPEEVKKSL